MSDNPQPDKVQPSGPAPTLTDAQLDAGATITPQDIARSMADARKHSPQLQAFLLARPTRLGR